MKIKIKILALGIFLVIFFLQVVSFSVVFAQADHPLDNTGSNTGLVPCGIARNPYTTDSKGVQTGGEILHPCDFTYLLIMVNYVINFVFKYMVVPVAAILFAYAGFEMVTSGGSPEQKGKAVSVFKNVAIGLVIAAASWLIVSLILSILGFQGSWIGF